MEAPNRFTLKRVGKSSPYVDWNSRCRYAVEAFRSIHAPWAEQVAELELMLLSEESEGK